MSISSTGVAGGGKPQCEGGTGSNGCGRGKASKEAALAGNMGTVGTARVVWARFTAPINGARK